MTKRAVYEMVELTQDCELGVKGERAIVVDIDGKCMRLTFFERTSDQYKLTGTDYAFLRRVSFEPEIAADALCPICGRKPSEPDSIGPASLRKLAELQRKSRAAMLAGIDEPIRKVAITVFVNSYAGCAEIANAMHAILTEAGVIAYELGVAPVEPKS